MTIEYFPEVHVLWHRMLDRSSILDANPRQNDSQR